MAVNYTKQHALGFAGLALLRNWLVGDEATILSILDEVSTVIGIGKDTPPLSNKKKVTLYNVPTGYQAWSATYDTIPNLLIEVEEPIVRSLLKNFNVGSALDAACGTGRYSKFLSSLGHKVIGVDLTPEMLTHAKARVPQVKFIQGNLNNLPLKTNSMDLAICSLALTHLSSIDQAILELSRVVHSGGHIILSDIHPLFVLIGGQAEFQSSDGKGGYIYNYVHLHSHYLEAFNKAGLKVNECIEIPLKKVNIESSKLSLNLSLSNNAVNAALEGLPLVLVWDLEKS